MAFFRIIICLTKSCSKCRRLLICIQMRNIPIGAHPKKGNSFSSFLCCEGYHRSWCSTGSMPQHHWRHTQQMAEQHSKRKINQRIEKILQFLYTVIRTANILIYIVPEQSAMTFLFQGANSARAVSVILVLGRRSSR